MRTLRLALAAALVAAAALAQDGAEKSSLLRGPVVSIDGAATLVDVTLAPGEKDARLLATWTTSEGTRTATVSFQPFAKRLRARLEAPPATSVTYDVVAASGSLAHGTLRTLPAPGTTALTFCALGDTGWPRRGDGQAGEPQLGVARLMEEQRPDLVLHTGDIIYLVGQWQSFDPLFFKPYAATLGRVPFFVTLGNHDVKTKDGKFTVDEFPFPTNQNGNRFYSFDAANVHFVCLDSNEIEVCESTEKFLATRQGEWLAADLAATKAMWKVVWFHYPLLSLNKSHKPETTIMRNVLEKVLDGAGVDLVVNGHDHFYHRSRRLRGHEPSDDGVVHVITGGGGAALYKGDPDKDRFTAEFASRFHFTRFDVDGMKMRIRAFGTDEGGKPEVFDDATIAPRKAR
ncbi:MAG: metallophosphoesterase [Planctomycetota bacterium]